MALKRTSIIGIFLLCMLAALSACGQAAAKLKPTATPTPPLPQAPKGWNAVASPRVGEEGNLQDVTLIAANNAWAVGSYYGIDALQRTLVERWDGATWSVVASPNPSAIANELDAISGDSASDIWAVGQVTSHTGQNFTSAPLIEHWNGTTWAVSPISASTLGSGDHTLAGIAALSPTDVWAVGQTTTQDASGSRLELPLIVHWDGSAWKTVSSPTVAGSTYYYLNAVTAIASNDVWAVGSDADAGFLPNGENGSGSLIEHWNGSAWSVVQDNASGAPSTDDVGALISVSAAGPTDVWAVGSGLYPYMGGCGAGTNRVMEHWDGQSWSYVNYPIPATGQGFFDFNHIAVVGPNDVWAVGGVNTYSRNTTPTAEHWDGSQWSITSLPALATATGFASVAAKAGVVLTVGQAAISNGYGATVVGQWTGSQWARMTSPSPGTLTNELTGLAAIGSKDVWAVGDSAAGTLSEHWNGAQWSVVPTPNKAAADNSLNAVAGTSASDVWAVGSGAGNGVIEHWDGSSWTVVPSSGAPLRGVAALSKTDAWAVGMGGALHWNGSAWTQSSGAPSPLLAVTAVSANDVWAVGGNPPQSCGGVMPAIIAHWNGTHWTSIPNLPQGILTSVSAVSSSDVWAVGGRLIMHWDGKQWSQVKAPGYAASVCAVASSDVWVVEGEGSGQDLAVMHWDGHAWSSQSLKPLGQGDNTLNAVAAVSPGELWAVGSYSQYYGEHQALIERYIA